MKFPSFPPQVLHMGDKNNTNKQKNFTLKLIYSRYSVPLKIHVMCTLIHVCVPKSNSSYCNLQYSYWNVISSNRKLSVCLLRMGKSS